MEHPLFHDINFDDLYNLRIPAPFVPKWGIRKAVPRWRLVAFAQRRCSLPRRGLHLLPPPPRAGTPPNSCRVTAKDDVSNFDTCFTSEKAQVTPPDGSDAPAAAAAPADDDDDGFDGFGGSGDEASV